MIGAWDMPRSCSVFFIHGVAQKSWRELNSTQPSEPFRRLEHRRAEVFLIVLRSPVSTCSEYPKKLTASVVGAFVRFSRRPVGCILEIKAICKRSCGLGAQGFRICVYLGFVFQLVSLRVPDLFCRFHPNICRKFFVLGYGKPETNQAHGRFSPTVLFWILVLVCWCCKEASCCCNMTTCTNIASIAS